jgi:ABC-type multidrug transport system ATPase subunit
MRIAEISGSRGIGKMGLEKFDLKGLNSLVLIAGANGSGKTRFLNLLLSNFNGIEQALENENRRIVIEGSSKPLQAVEIIPKSTSIVDDRILNKRDIGTHASSAESPNIGNLQQQAFPYIRKIIDRYFNSTHPQTRTDRSQKIEAKESYDRLQDLVKRFVGSSIERNIDGEPTLFGFQVSDARLSAGQAILLQIAVILHAKVRYLDNTVLLLDEPENHLHPAACVDVISKIRSAARQSQLWIATHSVGIISEFADQATLLFASNGKIEYAGSAPERILKTLIGSDEGIDKARDFMSLPSIFAQNRYAAECLLPPSVVAGGALDDQTRQISEAIQSMRPDGELLRILDWGAGKGRLLQNLLAIDPLVADKYDYKAFDPFPGDRKTCEAVIVANYGDANNRYSSDPSTISVQIDPGSIDVVVMCNVLHEIEPVEWLNIFGGSGPIHSSLSDDGFLLVVEDEEVPVGERAHKHGFIVFDTAELKALFNIKATDTGFKQSDQRDDGRLKAHLIPKACLSRITAQSRVAALKKRQQRASGEIKKIRSSAASYKNGRKLGFWLQQYANSSLALEELGTR